MDTENRLVGAMGWGAGVGKWVKGIKRYKIPVIRQIRRGGLMYSRGPQPLSCQPVLVRGLLGTGLPSRR